MNSLSAGSESFEDLKRLCGVFEHVEKLLTLAASLHRKFFQAPRLSEAFFSDYYSFYLQRMGTRSKDDNVQKVKSLNLQFTLFTDKSLAYENFRYSIQHALYLPWQITSFFENTKFLFIRFILIWKMI